MEENKEILTEMIKEARKFKTGDEYHFGGSEALIVEFRNGFGIAYEKTESFVEQETFDENGFCVNVARKKVPHISYRELEPTTDKVEGAKSLSGHDRGRRMAVFSKELESLLEAPQTSAQRSAYELESKLENCFDAITEPLQMEEYKFRDWKNILQGVGAIVGLTAIWPFSMAYILLGGMRKTDTSGDASLAFMMAPLALPSVLAYAAKEIISPTTKANRIKTTEILSQKPDKNSAYLFFPYDEKATPSRYNCVEFVVSDRIHLSDGERMVHTIINNGGSSTFCDERAIFVRKEEREDPEYGGKKWFFPVDKDLVTELESTIDEKEKLHDEYNSFYKQLNQKNQIAMLKSVGFV